MAGPTPDNPNARTVEQLVKYYQESSKRLREHVLNPPGSSDTAREYTRARAAVQITEVNKEIARLKKQAAEWTGAAVEASVKQGVTAAAEQARAAGVVSSRVSSPDIKGAFSGVNRDSVEIIARATTGDLYKAADAMGQQSIRALHRMADVGVTNAQVNEIIAGGVIEGKPRETVQALKQILENVNGEKVTVPSRSGGTVTYDTDYYADLVAHCKMSEAARHGRHAELRRLDLDLVRITGYPSKYPCSLLLGRIFSLSGKHPKYPAFSTVSDGSAPYFLFHPHCHKKDLPYVEGLADSAAA